MQENKNNTGQKAVDDSTDGRHIAQLLTLTLAVNGKMDVISELTLVKIMKGTNLEDV